MLASFRKTPGIQPAKAGFFNQRANPGFGIKPVQDKSEKEYLRVGKEYLSALYGRYRDWEKALAAYNAGMGNVEKAIGKAERYGGDWKEFLPKKKETLPYIEKILRKTNA